MSISEKRLKAIAGGDPFFFPGEVVAMACALLERPAIYQIAGESDNCRSSENVQVVQEQSGIAHVPDTLQNGVEVAAIPVNDVTTGKPLTITLPDISSKAFWSGTGRVKFSIRRRTGAGSKRRLSGIALSPVSMWR